MNSLTRPYSASSMEDTEVLKLHSALQRYCLSLTRSPWEADDLVQDAWLKALAPIRAGHANPEALLLRTARNAWLDRMRRQAVLLRKLPLLAQQQDMEAQQDAPSDAGLMEEAAFRTLARELSPLQHVGGRSEGGAPPRAPRPPLPAGRAAGRTPRSRRRSAGAAAPGPAGAHG
ncbi:RNA polymerase sigma factor [Paenibacillus stellifer]|uniref:RNA polymerase sigma factor n=1 Tax=Paenibacillus stellifer TaxID=169760 RepID=UPI00068B4105|nr:RNA polymerase sigma factor [Paenibacillus stellifer]